MRDSNISFEEIVMLDASSGLRETKDGYLVGTPRVARTGIQLYKGFEVGRPDLPQVRVYRPESEVMARDSLETLAGRPVTIEHPSEPVTARNWKDLAVGHIGEDIVRDGEFIRVPLILMDAKAVDQVRSGRQQLSVGYTAVLHWEDGKTDKGEAYDAIQTSIRANHVAITHAARGGDKLRMGDHQQEGHMAKRTLTLLDGIVVELEERDFQIVESHLAKMQKDLDAAHAARQTSDSALAVAKTEAATISTASQTKDAEIATLKKQMADCKMTPKQVQDAAKAWATTLAKAKALLGDKLVVTDETDEAALRRQVVSAKMGDTAKGWTDEMVTASFNTIEVIAGRDSDDERGGMQHLKHVISSASGGGPNELAKSYETYNNDISNRWKTAGQRAAS